MVTEIEEERIRHMRTAWYYMPSPKLQFHEIVAREFGMSFNEAYILIERLFKYE